MDIGLALPQYDYSLPGQQRLDWPTIVAWAQRAEQAGFGSLWLSDHLFLSLERYGGPATRYGALDPLPALAGLARLTRTARLGTLVLCSPLRPPAVLAKALATLDVLCDGRLTVGVGAGWFEPELASAGVPFPGPGARLRDLAAHISALRATWTGAEGAAPCLPRPVQKPHPPVWVGGKGDLLIETAVAHGDGWNVCWALTPEEYDARLEVLARACERHGRDPASLARSVGLYTLVGETEADLARRFERLAEGSPPGVLARTTLAEWRRGRLVGTVEQVREQLAAWDDRGVSTLVACLGAVPFAVTVPDDLDVVASLRP